MIITIATYLNGLVVSIGFLLIVVISLPIYLYRFILENVVVPLFFSKSMGQAVVPTSTMFATDFLDNTKTPRCFIVSNFVIEGHVPFSEVQEEILKKWINQQGGKAFPEFQQYVGSWMGFFFWHKDTMFHLNNHVFHHKIPKGSGSDDCEKWVCAKTEELLNKPLPLKRSPWEVHVIENYVNGDLSNKKMTAFVMRFHHSLADGFSILYAVIEQLFGMPLEKLSMPTASEASMSSATSTSLTKGVNNKTDIMNLLKYVMKVVYDVGSFSNLVLRPRTPWHVPDEKKTWKQLYARSKLIPIEKLKQVKTKYGVSFTGVIFACIAAGVSKSLHGNPSTGKGKKCGKNVVSSMPTMSVLPLPGHPKKLTNHAASALFDLPTGPDLDPVSRLKKCEQGLSIAKKSTIPFFAVLSVRVIGYHLASVSKLLLANRAVPMGLSNFPGPGKDIEWNGRKGLSTDFIAGALTGVAGAGFMVLSYRNHIRIAACVENAVMEKAQLEQLIEDMSQEIDCLLRLP